MKIGIIGAGAMGSGIAQVAATAGEKVVVYDASQEALDRSKNTLASTLLKLVEKGKLTTIESESIIGNIQYDDRMSSFSNCDLVIEAIVENLEVKKKVFAELEHIVGLTCVLASNTSSLSITSIASSCKHPERVLGIHFFNPAPLMALVEVIPALQTKVGLADEMASVMRKWGKSPVIAKDTPGFIVNRVARPFYGEAIRIYEEGIADMATIDAAMREIGGFRMGPFELMDLIGNDINYSVTESVFKSFYYDPRYRPSLTQKLHVDAGWLGRKTGRGYYNYDEASSKPTPVQDAELMQSVADRIIAMLVNEAYDALYLKIASAEDLDLAMTKGVNYPKGLISWGKEIGIDECVRRMNTLYDRYQEDRYRCSQGLMLA